MVAEQPTRRYFRSTVQRKHHGGCDETGDTPQSMVRLRFRIHVHGAIAVADEGDTALAEPIGQLIHDSRVRARAPVHYRYNGRCATRSVWYARPGTDERGTVVFRHARPMPGVRVGIERWTAFPGLFGYVEVKGGFANQWQTDNVYITQGKVHHKWVGGRIGGRLPVNVSYEFHHVAQWGGYSPIYGDLGNDMHSFMNAVLVRAGGSMANDQINAQGNHIGSQILTIDAKGDGWKVSAYWQNIFEDGPIRLIGTTMNVADGVWGVNVTQDKWQYISGLTYEFINTTDQSGPYHDKDGYIYGGADSYYRNSIYRNGWNYGYRTIGTPFITSPIYNADGTCDTKTTAYRHILWACAEIYLAIDTA